MAKTKTRYVIGSKNCRFIVTEDGDQNRYTTVFVTQEGRAAMLRDWYLPDEKSIRKFSSRLRAETYYRKNQEFFANRNFEIMPYNQNLLNAILYLKLVGL